jgi:CelD/BcsL family acetyltransferase involved in cellulose biosynthesis
MDHKPAQDDDRLPRRPTTAIEFGRVAKSAAEEQSEWRAWQQRSGCWNVSFQDWKQGRPVTMNLGRG